MSDLKIIITDAGRAALVNAAHNGTAPVVISHCGVSAAALAPSPTVTTLPGEIKRIRTLSGDVVAADTIHVTVRDESADAYALRSLALYLADDTLFAIYGQAMPIMEKSAQAMLLLAIDAQFTDVDATAISFGDTNFLNPAATTERQGVSELATDAETTTGTDPARVVTPKGLKAAVTKWLSDRFGRVDNTNDLEKPVSQATQDALNGKVDRVSANRPGVARLYRNDANFGHFLAHHNDGARWYLRGYDGAGNSGEVRVDYSGFAAVAGTVNWLSVANRPTALSQFDNDTGFITTAGRAYPRNSNNGAPINFYWVGQTTAPDWLWGGGDGTNMYVYSPANLPISNATQNALNGKVDRVSANRPGATRLYRRDEDSGFSVQNHWDGGRWWLRGYDGANAFHAECRVAYSDIAGAVDWSGVTNRPTALSSFTNNMGYITTDGRAFPRRANDGAAINFSWHDDGIQPQYFWGGDDGINMRVYPTRSLHVRYSDSAGSADTVDGYHGADLAKYTDFAGVNEPTGYCHLPGGRVLQWITLSVAEDSYFTFTFPLAMAYCGYAAAEGMGQVGNGGAANNNPRIYSWTGTSAAGYNPQHALTLRCFAIGYL